MRQVVTGGEGFRWWTNPGYRQFTVLKTFAFTDDTELDATAIDKMIAEGFIKEDESH